MTEWVSSFDKTILKYVLHMAVNSWASVITNGKSRELA